MAERFCDIVRVKDIDYTNITVNIYTTNTFLYPFYPMTYEILIMDLTTLLYHVSNSFPLSRGHAVT
jgi:hypothetical protein